MDMCLSVSLIDAGQMTLARREARLCRLAPPSQHEQQAQGRHGSQ